MINHLWLLNRDYKYTNASFLEEMKNSPSNECCLVRIIYFLLGELWKTSRIAEMAAM